MSDILQRLRCTVPCQDMTAKAGCHCAEAADTITALTARVRELEDMVNQSEAMALGYATENAAITARVEELEYALSTVMGTATHGQHMTWDERCKIGRAAITKGEKND